MNENENDINGYEPSLLRPRQIKKNSVPLTQNSTFRRCSLSLKRKRNQTTSNLNINNKENIYPGGQFINRNNKTKFLQLRSARHVYKENVNKKGIDFDNSLSTYGKCFLDKNKNSSRYISTQYDNDYKDCAIGNVNKTIHTDTSLFSASLQSDKTLSVNKCKENSNVSVILPQTSAKQENDANNKIIIDSSSCWDSCENLIGYNDVTPRKVEISLLISNKICQNVEIGTETCDIKDIRIHQSVNELLIYCNMLENAELSSCQSTTFQEDMDLENEDLDSTSFTMYVNVEVKKEKSQAVTEKEKKTQVNKVLILNTNAMGNISTVIVKPPNYKLVKRQILDKNKLKRRRITVLGISKKNASVNGHPGKWKQKSILNYFNKQSEFVDVSSQFHKTLLHENCTDKCLTFKNGKSFVNQGTVVEGYGQEMSKNLGLIESNQPEFKIGKSKSRNNEQLSKSKSPTFRSEKSPKKQNLKISSTIASRSSPLKSSYETVPNYSSCSPMRSVGSPELGVIKSKIKKNKNSISIPYYKIIAGTHFAVDAFCYGKIPHVENYFLTHFHSDHYTGLNKSFSKTVFCSKITAELCVTRLGVNPKCVSIINPDEIILIDGVEITAVDANHCPGAIMLIFTLLNGKTILHTGDFRATPAMESYPVFWNKDIHTVYLDTTYCNPRYDFPTQDQSLEMALYLLRQKKQEVEKAGRSFSSVLIVCGTYTIGKEKFLLGIARRVGCSVWACNEKATVLSAVEGHLYNIPPPQTCQLHALPMRDLTYEKLKSYLESFKGTFNEMVAFKPSGWENGKNSTIEKDKVTVHGIPYSEHSSFSEMVRFIKYLKPKLVVPTVDISGGVKTVQKYFPCPLVYKEDDAHQTRMTDYFSIQRQQVSAVT